MQTYIALVLGAPSETGRNPIGFALHLVGLLVVGQSFALNFAHSMEVANQEFPSILYQAGQEIDFYLESEISKNQNKKLNQYLKLMSDVVVNGKIEHPSWGPVSLKVTFDHNLSDSCNNKFAHVYHDEREGNGFLANLVICKSFFEISKREFKIQVLVHELGHVVLGVGECLPMHFEHWVAHVSNQSFFWAQWFWDSEDCSSQSELKLPPLKNAIIRSMGLIP
ncbi:MAG: hypothetical protein KDD43_01605 [Bdellovibrionales bacterium]|nr:hypothetical protein [Bdellovibrionales bacterium]